MGVADRAVRLVERVNVEAQSALTLLRAEGVGPWVTPPHRLIGVARAMEAYGPMGVALAAPLATRRGQVAIKDERGQVTFGELDTRTNALANAVRRRGLRPDDSIGILCRNHRGLFEALFGAAKLGARTVLLNTDLAASQLARVCTSEHVALLIHDTEFAEAAAAYSPRLGRVVASTNGSSDPITLDDLAHDGASTSPPRPAQRQWIVLLTSGTTGVPKGAPRSLGSTLALPGGYLSKIPFRSGRAVLIGAPVFHAWGLLGAAVALGLGNTAIMRRRLDAANTLDLLERHACDALVTVPVRLSRLLDLGADVIGSRNLTALRIIAVSGAALTPELAARARDVFGDIVYNLYGSTEVAYATIATPQDLLAAPGCVGKPPLGTTVQLLDRTGAEVGRGQTGRIFVGNPLQFDGYTEGVGNEKIGGLIATGDLGHFDSEGRLFLDGREDDMIVSGGENVYPAEVEQLLTTHHAVAEAAVVGVDDPEFGTRLSAYVVRVSGEKVDADELRSFVRANLARFKVPRDVTFVDQLPHNAAGKIVKRRLIEGSIGSHERHG